MKMKTNKTQRKRSGYVELVVREEECMMEGSVKEVGFKQEVKERGVLDEERKENVTDVGRGESEPERLK